MKTEQKEVEVNDNYPTPYQLSITEDPRPWGKFRQYPQEEISGIKIITVNPEQAPSLQYHHHRAEFWIVLDSGLEITLGDKTWFAEVGEEIWIPEVTVHRVRCVGVVPARFLEFWFGESSEDDIVRLADDYARLSIQ